MNSFQALTPYPNTVTFQYRLNLCKIVCDDDLFAWGIRDSDLCDFCRVETGDVLHIFFICPKVQPLMIYLRDLCIICQLNHDWMVEEYILSSIASKKTHILNFVCTFIKQYIYRCKCQGNLPKLQTLKIENCKYAQHRISHIPIRIECDERYAQMEPYHRIQ